MADWLPTFVHGVAGLPLVRDDFVYPLDGVDQWAALLSNPKSSRNGNGDAGSRVIVHEVGGDNHIRQESAFDPPYKLIRYFPTIYGHGQGAVCEPFNCPLGWNPLPGQGDPVPPPSAAEESASAA